MNEDNGGVELRKGISLWEDSFNRLKKDRLAMVCFWVIVGYFVVAVLGFFEFLGDPNANNPDIAKQPPSLDTFGQILGTNLHGQSVVARIAGGTWVAIALGFSTAMMTGPPDPPLVITEDSALVPC